MDFEIRPEVDTLRKLDTLFGNDEARWNEFFTRLPKDHPLATEYPDAHLVELVQGRRLKPGAALDLGCGNGRNSVYLAMNGFRVDALDVSETALAIASARAEQMGLKVQSIKGAFFDLHFEAGKYDLVYDFGCLHHVHPHRRADYFRFVSGAIKPGGHFVLGCFNELMGTTKSDAEIIEQRNMEGGLSLSPERLREFFANDFELVEMKNSRAMNSTVDGVSWEHMRISVWRRRD